MDKLLTFLDTYKGRDRILRLLSYSSKCAAGLVQSPETAQRFDNFSRQISTSRTCFRLLDDFPTVKGILDDVKKKKKESSQSKALFVFESVIDVIFNICDHLSWVIEHRILVSSSTIYDEGSTYCWVLSLYINICKSFVKLSSLSNQKLEIKDDEQKEQKKKIIEQQWYLQLTVLKCLADLCFAGNYLPKGVLWSNILQKWQVGALGTFSSLVALYQALLL